MCSRIPRHRAWRSRNLYRPRKTAFRLLQPLASKRHPNGMGVGRQHKQSDSSPRAADPGPIFTYQLFTRSRASRQVGAGTKFHPPPPTHPLARPHAGRQCTFHRFFSKEMLLQCSLPIQACELLMVLTALSSVAPERNEKGGLLD